MKKVRSYLWLLILLFVLPVIPVLSDSDSLMQEAAGHYQFSGMAGNWQTDFLLQEDGSFQGSYSDMNMGVSGVTENGESYLATVYYRSFSGRFRIGKKLDDYSFQLILEEYRFTGEDGDETVSENGTRSVNSPALGFERGYSYILYTSSFPSSKLDNDPRYRYFDDPSSAFMIGFCEGEDTAESYFVQIRDHRYTDYSTAYPAFLESGHLSFYGIGNEAPLQTVLRDLNQDGTPELITSNGAADPSHFGISVFYYDSLGDVYHLGKASGIPYYVDDPDWPGLFICENNLWTYYRYERWQLLSEPVASVSWEVNYEQRTDNDALFAAFCQSEKHLLMDIEIFPTAAEEPDLSRFENYPPNPTVALWSSSAGCYVTCDLGARDSKGKYANYDKPDFALIGAQKRQSYENFRLVSCGSEGVYALQSEVNGKYLGQKGIWNNKLKVEDDFIHEENKIRIDKVNSKFRIRFIKTGDWVSVNDGKLEVNSKQAYAEFFKMVTVDDNRYDAEERAVLSSSEWFNLNGKGVGYWNVQKELGDGLTDAIRHLEYHIMQHEDKKRDVIENWNMQSVVGVKKAEDGSYDVLIAFQGTCGYSDQMWDPLNASLDVSFNLLGARAGTCHLGYSCMSGFFFGTREKIKVWLDGKELSFQDLLIAGKQGKANFTILGHSMGGAIAQITAAVMHDAYGISANRIKGRTFNSALAVTQDYEKTFSNDWYNLCVTSDSVPRGLVPGSLNHYGMHRVGKTIWLYDNEPDKNIERNVIESAAKGITNIAEPKHNMDRKLSEILHTYADAGISIVFKEEIFYTNRDDVGLFSEPEKASQKKETIHASGTMLRTKGFVCNQYGNKWYLVSSVDGRTLNGEAFIYSGELNALTPIEFKTPRNTTLVCCADGAPLRNRLGPHSTIVGYLEYGDMIYPKCVFEQENGDIWFVTDYGWIYYGYLGIMADMNYSRIIPLARIRVSCPVSVSLYDADGTRIAYISSDGEMESLDLSRVIPVTAGEDKIFDVLDENEYHLEIETDRYGLMKYSVMRNYDIETGSFREGCLDPAKELLPEKKYESNVGALLPLDDLFLSVSSEGQDSLAELSRQLETEPEGTEPASEQELPSRTEEAVSEKDTQTEAGTDFASHWIMIGAATALVILIVVLIIMCRLRSRKKR